MSSLVVKTVEFDLSAHPNADLLMVARPKGMAWHCCVGKEEFATIDKAIYIPIDSLLPETLADFLNLPNRTEGRPYRVRTLKLRGLVSQGLMLSIERVKEYMGTQSLLGEENLSTIGFDCANLLNIQKHKDEYPEDADLMENPPGFVNWTDVESYNTFAHVLEEGTPVVLTEKIHGTSMKAGWMTDTNAFYIGSKKICFKPEAQNEYTAIADSLDLKNKLKPYPGYVIFGELFGPGVQKNAHYGRTNKDFRMFGAFNGERFLNWKEVEDLAEALSLPLVPILYKGPWSTALLDHADGLAFCNTQIKEGFVVTPLEEAFHQEVGRVILKVVSQKFLLKYD